MLGRCASQLRILIVAAIDDYLHLLRCPQCLGERLALQGIGVECERCEGKWPIEDGIVDFAVANVDVAGGDRAYDDALGRFYATYMDHFWLQAFDNWLLGLSSRRYRAWVRQRFASLPRGPVLEVPIGGAPFLSECAQDRNVPWVGVDLSWTMLRHVQRKCRERGIRSVLLLRADASRLPIRTGAIPAAVSLFGLHCFHDKAAVLRELHRSLKPEGELFASSLVTGRSKLADRYYDLYRRSGAFTDDSAVAQLTSSVDVAGFQRVREEYSGAAWLVEAVRAR